MQEHLARFYTNEAERANGFITVKMSVFKDDNQWPDQLTTFTNGANLADLFIAYQERMKLLRPDVGKCFGCYLLRGTRSPNGWKQTYASLPRYHFPQPEEYPHHDAKTL